LTGSAGTKATATDVAIAGFAGCGLGSIVVKLFGFARSDNFIIIKSFTNFESIKMGDWLVPLVS
jgi:hypothetical protein